MLSRRDEAEGGCGRAECVSPAKLTVTHRGSCVAVVRKVTPSKISVVLRLFLFHTLQISGTPSDKAEHFATHPCTWKIRQSAPCIALHLNEGHVELELSW